MRALYPLLIYLLIACYNCEACTSGLFHDSAKQCNKLDKTEPYCCYVHEKLKKKATTIENQYCESYKQNEYDKMETIVREKIKYYESNGYEVKKYSIDCNANYLDIALFVLILLLF